MPWRDPAQDRLIDWSATMGSNDSMPGVFTITDRKVWYHQHSFIYARLLIQLNIADAAGSTSCRQCKYYIFTVPGKICAVHHPVVLVAVSMQSVQWPTWVLILFGSGTQVKSS